MMSVQNVGSIEFGIYSPEEIRAMSVCHVDSTKLSGPRSVYDKAMGNIADNNEACMTCGLKKDCQGHFGHIDLAVPVPHPMYYKMIVAFLRCFCKNCYRLLLVEDQLALAGLTRLKNERRFVRILEKLKKVDICSHCSAPQPKIIYKPKDQNIFMEYKQKKDMKVSIVLGVEDIEKIFNNIQDNDVIMLGFDPKMIKPRNLILTVLPVLPPCSRPYVMTDGNICDDDLTYQTLEIIKINNQLKIIEQNPLDDEKNRTKAKAKMTTEQKKQKLIGQLRFKISTMYNNSKGKAKHPTDNRPIKCLKGRLAGKTGRIRSNIMGKRVNQSARTVIGAAPNLKMGQVGIPMKVARIHTKPETVTPYNIAWLQKIVNNNEANFIKRKRKDGTVTRINLKYAMFRRGTELLFGDIIVRGDITLEENKNGKVTVPEPQDSLEVTTIETTSSVNLKKGDQVIHKQKKIVCVSKDGKFKLKAGDVLVRGKCTLGKVDGVIQIPKPHGQIKVIQIISGNATLQDGDQLIRDGKLVEVKYPVKKNIRLQIGDVVQRHLRGPEVRNGRKVKGDVVLFNRQPTLHRGSMLAMEVVPGNVPGIPGLSYNTFRFNLAITKGFNADFDGDEMNIHSPQSYQTEIELRTLSAAQHNMISPQNSKPIVVPVQDTLIAVYMMTLKNMELTRTQFIEISQRGERVDGSPLWNPTKIRNIQRVLKKLGKKPIVYNGRGLISLILPDDLIYEDTNKVHPDEPVVKIQSGILVEGAINKKIIGSTANSLLLILHKEYGPEVAANFIDNLQFLCNGWLLVHGFSVGLEDCMITSDESKLAIRDTLTRCYAKAQAIEDSTHSPGIREIRVTAALSQAKDIGMRIAKDAMRDDNNFLFTVRSGAKGDFFNIAQLTGLLGQQNLEGQRIKPVLNHGKRTLPHYPFSGLSKEREYESRGFVSNSFIHGLTPEEVYFHSMSGREGISDTATGTARTGYIQRRIVKVCEDIQVQYDGTVRDAIGKIYQFSYGGSGLDPTKTVYVDNTPQICDVGRLVSRLNASIDDPVEEEVEDKATPSTRKVSKTVKKLISDIKREFPREKVDETWNEQDLRRRLQALRIANADSSDEDSDSD